MKDLFKKLIPKGIKAFISQIRPRVFLINTYTLESPIKITNLFKIEERFIVKHLTLEDECSIRKFYQHKSSYQEKIYPRLKLSAWVPLAIIDTSNGEIAYISWVIKENIPYLREFNIKLESHDYFLRHGYCSKDYRHLGLHTRMEQERINYCVMNGANKIYIQISNNNLKGIKSVMDNGFSLYKQDRAILITKYGVYRNFKAFLSNPFIKVI